MDISPTNAWRVCQTMGIRLHTRRDMHPRVLPPKETWSKRAIIDTGRAGTRKNSPEHVFDVLGLICASEVNSCQLYGETISGVSRYMIRHGIGSEMIGDLLPIFRDIDLGIIRQEVMRLKIDQRVPQIAMLIAAEVEARAA